MANRQSMFISAIVDLAFDPAKKDEEKKTSK